MFLSIFESFYFGNTGQFPPIGHTSINNNPCPRIPQVNSVDRADPVLLHIRLQVVAGGTLTTEFLGEFLGEFQSRILAVNLEHVVHGDHF